jgi:hypothetical protein
LTLFSENPSNPLQFIKTDPNDDPIIDVIIQGISRDRRSLVSSGIDRDGHVT